ncbi:hypothetical protein K3495_g2380 [Podosphaera aphanis]|nr:hypothetical protein K3495_g2380 [Podosphaera aphanis]
MRLPLAVSLAFVLTSAHTIKTRQTSWTIGQTVQTSSGPVTGQDGGSESSVSEYLGIPFAEPPVGDLRFAAPKKFSGTAPLNATKFGNSCYVRPSATTQNSAANNSTEKPQIEEVLELFSDSSPLNEDCLFLNVWTKPQVGEKKKAVMVWIYGGAFSFGSSSMPAYNGRNLAALEDVVVVSFNYRLNIFGFPGQPDGDYNVAILDQRMALEWVRDNIENFGGDSERITLFGQSAGAASIDFHTYAWATDPIASGFIEQSGNALNWGLPVSKDKIAEAWFNTSTKLGCGNATSPSDQIMSCMRSKSPAEIYAASPPNPTSQILGAFSPTADDVIVFSNYSDRVPAKVPMLVGNNDYEAGLFRTEFSLLGINLTDSFWMDFNLQEFTCPCSDRANISLANDVPTWRYRYMGVFPNLAISPYAGAWHAAEIPVILNNMPKSPLPTPEEIEIGNYTRGAWAAFAKDPNEGLSKYGWPQYDPTQDTLIRISNDNKVGPNLIRPYRYDADCPFINITSTDPTITPNLPDLGADVTPTAAIGGSPTETAPAKKTSPPDNGTMI